MLVVAVVVARCGSLDCKHFDVRWGVLVLEEVFVHIAALVERRIRLVVEVSVDNRRNPAVVVEGAVDSHHIAVEEECRSRREVEVMKDLVEGIRTLVAVVGIAVAAAAEEEDNHSRSGVEVDPRGIAALDSRTWWAWRWWMKLWK